MIFGFINILKQQFRYQKKINELQKQNRNLIYPSQSAVTSSNFCACSEITQQSDCVNGCGWVTVGSTSSCTSAAVTVDCTKQSGQDACNNQATCVWKNNACATFSACSDVLTTATTTCSNKSMKCTNGAKVGDPCADVKCSSLTAATCTGAYESATSVCSWSNNACVAINTSKCSTITDSTICASIKAGACNWNNNACSARTCASITDTTKCLSVLSDDFKTISVCAVSGTTCADAADTKALTASTCKTNTYNYFAWNGTSCNACVGAASKSYVLSFIGILAVLWI